MTFEVSKHLKIVNFCADLGSESIFSMYCFGVEDI